MRGHPMQYMEFYAVRHDTGAVLPNATLQAFPAGGSTPVALFNEAGIAQGVQVTADGLGHVGVALPFGAYDLQISSGAYAPPKISGITFGDAMSAGLFGDLAHLSVPQGVSLIQTTGHAKAGLGAARYAVHRQHRRHALAGADRRRPLVRAGRALARRGHVRRGRRRRGRRHLSAQTPTSPTSPRR